MINELLEVTDHLLLGIGVVALGLACAIGWIGYQRRTRTGSPFVRRSTR